MSATTFGWLVLLFPLLGTLVIGFGFRVLPGLLADQHAARKQQVRLAADDLEYFHAQEPHEKGGIPGRSRLLPAR